MKPYVISCCSTADLSEAHFLARDIHYVCFHYMMDGKQYADDLGKSMPFHDFYRAMADGAQTRTSQVNAEEFVAYFTPFLEQG
ncbi:MAG: DegV family protein, partial [Clostridia bacterium]